MGICEKNGMTRRKQEGRERKAADNAVVVLVEQSVWGISPENVLTLV